MEVSIISVDNIRPLSVTNGGMNPFKLSLLDQIMPPSYSPIVHFYPINPTTSHHHKSSVSDHLKASLSRTLDPFYPLSGRVNENCTMVHNFHKGVPFLETRIQGQCLFDFLQPPKLDFLSNLIPLEPFAILPDGPQLAVQLNTFDCGGIALGLSFCHQLIDGGTGSAFLRAWAANSTNPGHPSATTTEAHPPNLASGSSVFPPMESLPPITAALNEQRGVRRRTRRFVFDKDAISELRSSSTSGEVANPTRGEALYALIWKSAMQAANVTQSPRLQSVTQAVNMRSLMGQRLSNRSIGNLLYPLIISCPTDAPTMKELVALLRQGMAGVEGNHFNSATIAQQFATIATMAGGCEEEILVCSSWTGFGFNDFDFGLGNPVWSGLAGDSKGGGIRASMRNSLVVLKEVGGRRSGNNNGIEAWITLREDVMALLETDPHFLKYASPNPSVTFNFQLATCVS